MLEIENGTAVPSTATVQRQALLNNKSPYPSTPLSYKFAPSPCNPLRTVASICHQFPKSTTTEGEGVATPSLPYGTDLNTSWLGFAVPEDPSANAKVNAAPTWYIESNDWQDLGTIGTHLVVV